MWKLKERERETYLRAMCLHENACRRKREGERGERELCNNKLIASFTVFIMSILLTYVIMTWLLFRILLQNVVK